jgi:hypothetical protein
VECDRLLSDEDFKRINRLRKKMIMEKLSGMKKK